MKKNKKRILIFFFLFGIHSYLIFFFFFLVKVKDFYSAQASEVRFENKFIHFQNISFYFIPKSCRPTVQWSPWDSLYSGLDSS